MKSSALKQPVDWELRDETQKRSVIVGVSVSVSSSCDEPTLSRLAGVVGKCSNRYACNVRHISDASSVNGTRKRVPSRVSSPGQLQF